MRDDVAVTSLFQLVRQEERFPSESFRGYKETNRCHSQPDKRTRHEEMGRRHVSYPDVITAHAHALNSEAMLSNRFILKWLPVDIDHTAYTARTHPLTYVHMHTRAHTLTHAGHTLKKKNI